MGDASERPDGSRNGDEGSTWRRDLGVGHPLSPDTDDPSDPAGDETADDPLDPTENERSTYGRRTVLLAGAAGVAAASLGWATALDIGGDDPDGAGRVATDYVNAIDDNDWAAAGALFHEASEFARNGGSYEAWLRQRGRLDGYRDISPSVDARFTFFHVTDPEQAAAEGESLGADLDPAAIAELKRIAAVVSVRQENLDTTATEAEYLGPSKSSFSFTLVDGDAGWRILSVFGPA